MLTKMDIFSYKSILYTGKVNCFSTRAENKLCQQENDFCRKNIMGETWEEKLDGSHPIVI